MLEKPLASITHRRAPLAHAVAMVLGDDADDAAILDDRPLDRRVGVNLGARRDGAPGEMLVDAAHIQHAADGVGVVEARLAVGREEGHTCGWGNRARSGMPSARISLIQLPPLVWTG